MTGAGDTEFIQYSIECILNFMCTFIVPVGLEGCIPPCHSKAECKNAAGEFYCKCMNGYHGDGTLCIGIY